MAEGLAYWSCRYLPLGVLPDAPRTGRGAHTDPVALLRRLRASPSEARLIVERMHQAAQDGAVNAVASRLIVTEDTPRLLARAAAQALAGSGNFTALHLVTATHAMRVLTRFVDEPLVAWRSFWPQRRKLLPEFDWGRIPGAILLRLPFRRRVAG